MVYSSDLKVNVVGQKIMATIFAAIPGVVVYINDIVVYRETSLQMTSPSKESLTPSATTILR